MTLPNQPQTINPPTVVIPPPTYNQVCITPIQTQSKLITLAGQTGIDPTTNKMTTGIIAQSRMAYTNVRKCLEAAGATPRDIIHVRHYIVDNGDGGDVVERGWGPLWIEFMDCEAEGHRPPDTVVGVASLAKAGILYEVEVWALVNRA